MSPQILSLVLIIILLIFLNFDFSSCYSRLKLTPLIKANKINEARNLSSVTSLPNAPKFESYSGFITVDEIYDSNLFFWFIPSQVSYQLPC